MSVKRPKHKTKWVLCTKWFQPVPKPIVLTEEEKMADTPPKKNLEFDYLPMWTPIGDPVVVERRGKKWHNVYEYDSQEEATQALKDILAVKPDVAKLLFCTCEVRYVPNKIRVYKRQWFDKYVIKEVMLKVEQPTSEDVFDDKVVNDKLNP